LKSPQGLISNIERFALNDGPGIRTLVFMKGCPMRCLWCSSPQTQNLSPEILYDVDTCQKCGDCIGACPAEAMIMSEEDGVRIDRALCNGCSECIEACPNQALELAGSYVAPWELVKEIKKDSSYYRRSGGGITVGGGEPTMQHEFVLEFIRRLSDLYIATAMETCAHTKWENLEQLLPYLALVYIDIKHMDAATHRELTGVSNELILENTHRVSSVSPLIIRVPAVPGCNDSEENISATAKFAAELGENLKRVELLPYHRLGVETYARLGREYRLPDVEPPDERRLMELKGIIESFGVSSQIGG